MPSKKKSLPASTLLGGRGSTAGDIYHELWALRAALQLLTPKTELKAVTVEGIAAPPGSTFEYAAVDCGLFYGGQTLETARAIELVQLKYSTAKPDDKWTVARLVHSAAKTKNNSVLRGLAQSFTAARAAKTATATLTIKMVSNQPISSDVITAIKKITTGTSGGEDCKKIEGAAGLKGVLLTEFLSSLSFEGMGGPSRTGLQHAIGTAIAQMSGGDIEQTVDAYRSKIRDLMAPGHERERITRGTVLFWFGVASETGIFPAPPELQPLGEIITRKPSEEVIEKLKEGSRLICLDGPGGCGKTTTMRQLEKLMPAGSMTVLYDCYGAGRYMHSDQKRHLPENAFLQIANDLAFAQGLPLFIPNQTSSKIDIRRFKERLIQSAEILAKTDPKAILAILIDAADNSVNAAKHWDEPCFALEIAAADLASLPKNIAIIFSTRTARKDRLKLPAYAASVQCPAFERGETRAFADLNLRPSVDEVWLDQFHRLSRGVPRVQAAAVKAGEANPTKVLQSLMPVGKGLNDVFEELLSEAAKKVGDDQFYRRCVTALGSLPPPIPISHLAAICGASEDVVTDFILDVSPWLRMENRAVSISDEDLEDFLEAKSVPQKADLIKTACSVLGPLADTDTYAATHICDLLVEAGRASEVLGMVERDLEPKGIIDPIVKREVQLRRLRLAMNACASKANPTDMLKVALLGAEASKDEDALRNLLEQSPELSVRFAEGSLQRLVLSDHDRFGRQGAVLVHQASRAALAGDKVGALERIHLYEQWVEVVRALPRNRQHDIKFSEEETIAIAEARILTEGTNRWLKRAHTWPIGEQVATGSSIVPRLIRQGRLDVVKSAYHKKILSNKCGMFLTVPLAIAGEAVAASRIAAELQSILDLKVPDIRYARDTQITYLELVVTLCELAFSRNRARRAVIGILDQILDHRSTPSTKLNRNEAARLDIAIRAWLLRERLHGRAFSKEAFAEFCSSDNSPPKPPPTEEDKVKKKQKSREEIDAENREASEREHTFRVVSAIYSLYSARVAILYEAACGKLDAKPKTELPVLGDDYSFNREYHANNFRIAAGKSVARLMHLRSIDVLYLMERSLDIGRSGTDGVTAFRSLPIWREFLVREEVQTVILAEITTRAASMATIRTSARDKVSALLNFSVLVLPFSEYDAQALFNQAVEIAKEIDREAMVQIEFIAALARRSADHLQVVRKSLGRTFAAFITDVSIRLEGEDRFPWEKAVQGLYDFDPGTSLAALSQWHDEGLARLTTVLAPFLEKLAQDDSNIEYACAMTALLRYIGSSTMQTLADSANAAQAPRAGAMLEVLAKKVAFDVATERRANLASALTSQPNFNSLATPVERYLIDAYGTKPLSKRRFGAHRAGVDVRFAKSAKFDTEAEIRRSLAAVRAALKSKYVPLSTILAKLRLKITKPGQRVPFLCALSQIENPYDTEDHALAILTALDDWKGQPAIESWRKNQLPIFLSKHFRLLTRWLGEGQSQLPALLKVSSLDDTGVLKLVGGALQTTAQEFSSGTLYAICELLAGYLAPTDASDLAQWYLTRAGRYLLPDMTDRFLPALMPTNLLDALGRFLFAMMSDIDVRLRWRAAHSLRMATDLDGGKLLSAIYSSYDRTLDDGFRLAGAPFYWLAARLWLTMTTARVALEHPTAIVPHTSKLLSIATSTDLPHFLIRHHAKRALQLAQYAGAVVLEPVQQRALEAANVSKLVPVKGKPNFGRGLDHLGRRGGRFHFGMDTVPYWYSPLHEQFAGLPPDAFFNAVERWVVDEWGADDTANHWDKEPRKARISNESMRTYHSHGSMPTIERYGTYLEWQGMFCALGDLLQKYPLKEQEGAWNNLDHWLERWLPTEGDTWLSDRRALPPLSSEFKVARGGSDKYWLKQAPLEQFLSVVLGDRADRLSPYATWRVATPTREVHVEINCALVSPPTAVALARALSGGEQKYWLPTESHHDDFEGEFNQEPFKIVPLVHAISRDTQFDKEDPLTKDVSELQVEPAHALAKKYNWSKFGIPVDCWARKATECLFGYDAWSEADDRESGSSGRSERQLGVEGYRLTLDKKELLAILKSEKLDLVVEVSIERRLENENGERNRWDDKTKRTKVRKAFVFRKNGKIESIGEPVGTWR